MKAVIGVILLGLASLSFILPKGGYEIGDSVSDFSLKNIDGKMISLSSFKDNSGVIVVFDCNTCPVSKAYNSRILALSKKYEKTFPLVAINSNDPDQSPGDSFSKMISYARAKGYTFPYLIDETQNVAKTFGATNTPHVFILAKSGENYKVVYIGAIDDNTKSESGVSKKYVEQAVSSLLAGNQVAVTKTRAIGCGIKWK